MLLVSGEALLVDIHMCDKNSRDSKRAEAHGVTAILFFASHTANKGHSRARPTLIFCRCGTRTIRSQRVADNWINQTRMESLDTVAPSRCGYLLCKEVCIASVAVRRTKTSAPQLVLVKPLISKTPVMNLQRKLHLSKVTHSKGNAFACGTGDLKLKS